MILRRTLSPHNAALLMTTNIAPAEEIRKHLNVDRQISGQEWRCDGLLSGHARHRHSETRLIIFRAAHLDLPFTRHYDLLDDIKAQT
jgi:hypothetical protein